MKDGIKTTAYDFDCVDLYGKPFFLKQFTGQPLIIVNTASLCGFSSQYNELETIWQKHKDSGLVVLGVPSNDFGRQEPGNSEKIASLCSIKFGVTFPLLQKAPIKGEQAHPLFKWLSSEGGFIAKPRWNFYKYVIGRNGQLREWFSPLTSPSMQRFNRAVADVVAKT